MSSRLDRATGARMEGKTVMFRGPATSLRANRFGMASQMAHEQAGRTQRADFAKLIADRKSERRAALNKVSSKDKETGMNAGTMGRSRVSK